MRRKQEIPEIPEEQKRNRSTSKEKDLTNSSAAKLLNPKQPPRKKVDGLDLSSAPRPENPAAPQREGPPEIFLHRNPKGGIFVHEKDIETLFSFIDVNHHGRITMQDLKKKLSLFAKEMTNKDYKFLMAGKSEISIRELHDILKYNELEDFDPIAEAFSFFDPDNTGYVDMNRLREIFSMLGYEELTYADLQILVECADADLDGKISLEDFRKLIPVYTPPDPEQYKKNINIVRDPELHAQFVSNLKDYGDSKNNKSVS